MHFDDLKLPPGTSLQLQMTNSLGQPERYTCRFVGCFSERSLLFSVPRMSGKAARFRPGQKLAVRLMVANGIGVFACTVEAQTTDPHPLLYVTYPDAVKFKGIRGATRIAVELPVMAANTSAIAPVKCPGKIADISISGARLELKKAIGEIGDNITLAVQMQVVDVLRDVRLSAIIRSRVERSTQEDSLEYPAVYGIEFTEPNVDERLVLYAYVFSQIVAEQMPEESL